ncbi:hypothetical protein QE359_003000 [Curtobacterium sp. SORGH_AS776]|nr:hypothetical protein [Curtobacterium sp. SORGH_AS_0776]
MRAERPGRGGGLEHGGELRAADGGHHARGAHGAGSDADLDDARAGLNEVGDRVGGDDVARDERDVEAEGGDGAEGAEHALLVAVRGVEDEHVDAGGREGLCLRGDVAVDADRGGDPQASGRVDGGPVDVRADRAGLADRADDLAVPHDGREVDLGRGQHVVHVPGRAGVLGVDRGGGAVQQVAERGVGTRVAEAPGGDAAEVLAGGVADDHAPSRDGQELLEGLGDRGVRAHVVGGVEVDRLVLDPADRGVEVLQVHVLRQDAQAAAPGERRGEARPGDRVHVGADDRDGRTGPVVRREVHVEPARHRRPGGDEEDVGVGQVVCRPRLVEPHGPHCTAPQGGRSGRLGTPPVRHARHPVGRRDPPPPDTERSSASG